MQSLGGTSLAGSVCAADIKNSYENVAKIIADRGVRFPLTSKASGSGFSVYVDGQKIDFSPDNYIYEASSNSIVFTGFVPKKGAKIEIVYNQEQAG
jgi:hypothetical protein